MIERTRIYQYEPRALARDKSRRFFARLRSFILRAFAVLLIAAAVFLALMSLTPAHGESGCEPAYPALCWYVSPPPPPPSHVIYLPVVER